jgi:hypothetical protein
MVEKLIKPYLGTKTRIEVNTQQHWNELCKILRSKCDLKFKPKDFKIYNPIFIHLDNQGCESFSGDSMKNDLKTIQSTTLFNNIKI